METHRDQGSSNRSGSMPGAHRVIERSISLRAYYGQLCSPEECVQRELSRVKLFNESYLYCVFHPSKLELVRTAGSYRADAIHDEFRLGGTPSDWIFACSILKSMNGSLVLCDCDADSADRSIVRYLEKLDADTGYIAVYDRRAFWDEQLPAARFIDPSRKLEALVAIVSVSFE